MATSKATVGPLGEAVLGVPERCPACGGRLAPLFGETVGDDGRRRPVIDPTVAGCRDCRTVFQVRRDGRSDGE